VAGPGPGARWHERVRAGDLRRAGAARRGNVVVTTGTRLRNARGLDLSSTC
jgi:hypothetical protein